VTPTEHFMSAVQQHPDAKPMRNAETLHVMLYGVIVELKQGATIVRLEKILSTIHPGEGRASRALRTVCDIADATGVTVTGEIKPFAEGLDQTALRSWYARFGFTVEGDKIERSHNRIGHATSSNERTNLCRG
jgi:hypothetical protein